MVIDSLQRHLPPACPVDEVVELRRPLGETRCPRRNPFGRAAAPLDLAVGIAGDPELLFLDEPTTSFDPSARRRAWELVDRLRALDKTILLTTHYMEEAQRLADRVAILIYVSLVPEDPSSLAGRGVALPW